MKFAFDVRPFLSGETGVGVYYRNLLNNLALVDKSNEYMLFSSSLKERFPASAVPAFSNFTLRDMRIPVKILNYLWYKKKFPSIDMFFGTSVDLTHSPSPVIIPTKGRKIITLHDLCFLDNPELVMNEAIDHFATETEKNIAEADGIVAVSEATKAALIRHFGNKYANKTRVIYHGTDMADLKETAPPFKLPEKYILAVGTIEPRKDYRTLLKAFADLNSSDNSPKLVIVGGKGWKESSLPDFITRLRIEDRVIFTGYMSRGNLKHLYSNAELYVFPSLYEGFGLPLLEAASMGVPAIASDLKVFKEVFRDYPVYFNTGSPSALTEKLNIVLNSKDVMRKSADRGKALSKEYSWRKTAEETLQFYNEVLK